MFRVTVLILAVTPWATAQGVNVLDFGARGNGSDLIATTAAFSTALQSSPAGLVRVPPGVYAIDNNAGPFLVKDFSGQLIFEGGAKLIFANSHNGGIWFIGGTGARIQGLRVSYATTPLTRNSPQEAIKFSSTVDTVLTDVTVESSPAAGILFFDSIRPRVVNAAILSSQADGLHFANCQDAQVNGLTTSNTGDDGLAFLNYATFEDRNGGTANNVVVRNARARGITVVGSSDIVVSNFVIERTASSGLLCANDTHYTTRTPDRVMFTNGVIRNAGDVSPQVGNAFGIEYYGQKSCSFTNIEIVNAAGSGVAGMAPEGRVRIANIRVQGNAQGAAFNLTQTAAVEIDSATAEDTPQYGFFFGNSGTVVAKGLTAINTSQRDVLARAIWFENNQRVLASDLRIIDSQETATGYIVGAYQNGVTQKGVLSGISAAIERGQLAVTNTSSLAILGSR